MDPRIDLHDEVAWRSGRASDVPPTGKGSNPFNEEAGAEAAKAPAVYEIVCLTKEGGPLTKEISLNDDGSTTRASCRAVSRSESRWPVLPSWRR
jgi:hypothetical protein